MRHAALGLAATLGVACLSPTEVDVAVRTDVPCSRVTGTVVYGGASLVAEAGLGTAGVSTYCDATGYLGTLVFVPTGIKSGPLDVEVVTGLDGTAPETCAALNYQGCIVERRAWQFQPHEPVQATVAMAMACIGVACDASSTCVEGACASIASASCGFETCTGDAAIDGRVEDAGSEAGDGGQDGGQDSAMGDSAAHDATLDARGGDTGTPTDGPSDATLDALDALDAPLDATVDAMDATLHDTGVPDTAPPEDATLGDAAIGDSTADAPQDVADSGREVGLATDGGDASPPDAPPEDASSADAAPPDAGVAEDANADGAVGDAGEAG